MGEQRLSKDFYKRESSVNELPQSDLLQYAIENGMIDLDTIQKQIEMNERKKYLEMHTYKVWQSETDSKWRTHLPDEEKGRKLVKKSTKEDIENAIIKYYKSIEVKEDTANKNITLKQIFPEWISFKSIHTESTSYIKKITADWKKYYSIQTEFINKPLRKMTKLELDEWAHGMIKKYNLTKRAYYNMSIILRQCLDYAVEKGIIESNEFQKVKINTKLFKHTKKKTGETQVYSECEEERLINDMIRRFNRHPENTAPLAVMFMFETGLRIGEVCALKFDDISNGYISIQRQEVRDYEFEDEFNMKFRGFKVAEYAKTEDGYRDVYLTENARKILHICQIINQRYGYDKRDNYIFYSKGKRANHYSIQAMIKRGCEYIDIMVKSAHKIRKTYISTLIDSGLNIDEIRRTVGHSDERTTYGNYCFNRKTQKQTEDIIEFALASKKVTKSNQIFNMQNMEKQCIFAAN